MTHLLVVERLPVDGLEERMSLDFLDVLLAAAQSVCAHVNHHNNMTSFLVIHIKHICRVILLKQRNLLDVRTHTAHVVHVPTL